MFAFLKSTGISFLAHALALWGLYAWPLRSADRMTFSGSRQVVTIEASMASESVPSTTPVQVPPEQVLTELEQVESTPPTLEPSQLQPRTENRHPSDRPLPAPRVARAPQPTAPQRRAIEPPKFTRRVTANSLPTPTDAPVRPPRPLASFAKPTVSMPQLEPAEQVLGVDDRQAVDFSGNPPPVYPAQAVQQRLQGTVLLRLHVRVDGTIDKVQVQQSSGHAILDQAATEAVMKWQGKPANRDGRAKPTVEVLPVKFRL